MATGESYLVISDLQIPFEHSDALNFCRYLKKHYKVKAENVLCVGDELDEFWGGLWDKDANFEHTPRSEIYEAIKSLRPWFKEFPQMKIAISNHGQRYFRKAMKAQIPSEFMRCYTEVFGFPKTWKLKKNWHIKGTKKPFIMEHGDDYGGQRAHVVAAMHNGMSTVIGHHHSLAALEHVVTNGLDIWAMAVGSLIDFDQYAFEYARTAKKKPVVSCGLILDGGLQPIIVRYDGREIA